MSATVKAPPCQEHSRAGNAVTLNVARDIVAACVESLGVEVEPAA